MCVCVVLRLSCSIVVYGTCHWYAEECVPQQEAEPKESPGKDELLRQAARTVSHAPADAGNPPPPVTARGIVIRLMGHTFACFSYKVNPIDFKLGLYHLNTWDNIMAAAPAVTG
ncbi:uncharacterized protein LOC144003168 isoform X2 [Festucalex cinctus]